jgi:hypothetical protein
MSIWQPTNALGGRIRLRRMAKGSEDISKALRFAQAAKKILARATFDTQAKVLQPLEELYGISVKEVVDIAMDLADRGHVRKAEELANSVMILKGGPGLWLSFDRSLIPTPKLVESKKVEVNEGNAKEVFDQFRLVSPSVDLLARIRERKISLDELHWRQFEEVIAELLEEDGWTVTLRQGSKDGGVDIEAKRNLPGAGPILTVWQAKHLRRGKVGIDVVRELADSTREFGASKGVIVTSSFLTKGALQRIKRDTYQLWKVERNDLLRWIQRNENTN